MNLAAQLLVLAGALLTLTAAVGLTRLRTTYARLHAATKATSLGILLTTTGAALVLSTLTNALELALVAVLYLITFPIGTHLLARATHHHTSR